MVYKNDVKKVRRLKSGEALRWLKLTEHEHIFGNELKCGECLKEINRREEPFVYYVFERAVFLCGGCMQKQVNEWIESQTGFEVVFME